MGATSKLGFFGRITVWWKVLRDPRTPWWAKLAFLVAAIGYSAWPIDAVPDVPVVGWADDVVVVSLLAWVFTKLAPKVARHDAVAAVLAKFRDIQGDDPNLKNDD